MPTLNGKFYTREEFLRYTGNFANFAGITPLTLDGGSARGGRALLLRTGGGLEATILPDRCLDLLSLRYRGVNLSQMAKNGLTSPASGVPVPGAFDAAVEGGMLFTAGLLNIGPESTDEGRYHAPHGRIGLAAAEQLTAEGEWEGDEYLFRIRGVMRESRLFGENLTLTRTWTTRLGSNRLELCDRVENLSPEAVDWCLLYHCNLGFPFLSPELKLIFPQNTVTPRTPEAAAGLAEAEVVTAPQDGFFEHVFIRAMTADADGKVTVRAENPALGVGLALAYEQEHLPCFLQWKSMRSGDYALGLEPATSLLRGRAGERAAGALPRLAPFGSVTLRLAFEADSLA